jgi:glycosyltransferase involved in cell wall biosynthesis
MDNNALVSVIVPVYNVKLYLEHCLASISVQSYKNLEIILVDDGSTDGSGDICETFAKSDSRCVVVHQENQGLWAARNTGQRIAKGEFVMFVDSDDYIHVNMIELMCDALVQNPQCGFAICKYKSTESSDENTHVKCDSNYQILSIEKVLGVDDEGFVYVVWNKLYRRSLIEGLYARNYRIAQDVDYNIRVYLRLEYVAFVEQDLYFWMQRGNSATHKSDYWYSANMILTDIYYRNYNELCNKAVIIRDHILKSLYARLLFFKVYAWHTEKEKDVSLKCRQLIKKTWRSYLSCRRIPFFKRLYVLVLLCTPPVLIHKLLPVRGMFRKLLVRFK